MKKIFRVTGLDCPNCAAKMQRGIEKLDGVNEVTVDFIGQKIVLDAEEADFADVIDRMVRVCKKVDSDCIVNV
ncbi:MAG: cation transporter [Christensenellales bacterium]|jgi:hypothetical protein